MGIKMYIGLFLIAAGVLPFFGVSFGMLQTVVNVLMIIAGVYLIVK